MDEERIYPFHKVYFAAVMNQKYEGGGFKFCPDASPSDGYLDVIVVDGLSKLKVLFCLPTAYTVHRNPYLPLQKGRSIQYCPTCGT